MPEIMQKMAEKLKKIELFSFTYQAKNDKINMYDKMHFSVFGYRLAPDTADVLLSRVHFIDNP